MNNDLNLNDLLPRVQATVREASRLMMDREHLLVKTKGSVTNLCTSADLAVQDFLYKELRALLPGSGFLGEENDLLDTQHEYVWIVDPIDGTANFARELPECCISVALKGNDEILLGVVYNPYRDQLFDAVKGGGSRLNEEPIHVSGRPFEQGMLITALCLYHKEHAEVCSDIILEAYQKCNDVRRFGSCAIELCYLACGLCELYFEYRIMPWDYAAAYLVLTEAGGVLTGPAGTRLHFDGPTILVGANSPENHQILSDIVSRHIA